MLLGETSHLKNMVCEKPQQLKHQFRCGAKWDVMIKTCWGRPCKRKNTQKGEIKWPKRKIKVMKMTKNTRKVKQRQTLLKNQSPFSWSNLPLANTTYRCFWTTGTFYFYSSCNCWSLFLFLCMQQEQKETEVHKADFRGYSFPPWGKTIYAATCWSRQCKRAATVWVNQREVSQIIQICFKNLKACCFWWHLLVLKTFSAINSNHNVMVHPV